MFPDFFLITLEEHRIRIQLLIPIFPPLFPALRGNFYLKLPALHVVLSKHKLLQRL